MKLPSLRSCADVTTKYRFFCICNISKTKQTSARKHTEHALTHLIKTTCKIWSVSDKVQFWVKNLPPFFHWSLQLMHLISALRMWEIPFLRNSVLIIFQGRMPYLDPLQRNAFATAYLVGRTPSRKSCICPRSGSTGGLHTDYWLYLSWPTTEKLRSECYGFS